MASLWQRARAVARYQWSAETEIEEVRQVRVSLANLSIFFGLMAVVFLAFGDFRLRELPAWLAMLLGGVLGVGVWIARDARLSRRCGKAAFVLTVLGVGALFAIKGLL